MVATAGAASSCWRRKSTASWAFAGREDRAGIAFEQLDELRDIGGVLDLAVDRKLGAQERGAEFGNQFFSLVGMGIETFDQRGISVEPRCVPRPVNKLVELDGRVDGFVAEGRERRQHDRILGGRVESPRLLSHRPRNDALFYSCTYSGNELVDQAIALVRVGRLAGCSQRVRKSITLSDVEHRVGLQKSVRSRVLGVLVFLALGIPDEHDMVAVLTLADSAARRLSLFKG
jgi:hypothetical protein